MLPLRFQTKQNKTKQTKQNKTGAKDYCSKPQMLNVTDSVEELKQERGRRQRVHHEENVTWRLCNHFSIITRRLTGKMGAVYPGIKFE